MKKAKREQIECTISKRCQMNVKQIIKILLNVSVRSGGEGFCLSQKMLQKHVLLAKAGFDIGENEPHDFLGALLGDSCPPPRSCSSCRRSARLLLLSSRSRLRFKVAVGEHTRAPRAERSCAERFRGESEKESEKPKVITENEPSMDEPTSTTIDSLEKTKRDCASCKYCTSGC